MHGITIPENLGKERVERYLLRKTTGGKAEIESKAE